MPTRAYHAASVTRNDGSFAWFSPVMRSLHILKHSEKLFFFCFFFFFSPPHKHKKVPSFPRSMDLSRSAESGKVIGSRTKCSEVLFEDPLIGPRIIDRRPNSKTNSRTSSSPWKLDNGSSKPSKGKVGRNFEIATWILSSRKFATMQLKLSICNRIHDELMDTKRRNYRRFQWPESIRNDALP